MFLFSDFNAVSLQNQALISCLSSIWQTLPTGSLAGSSSLTQPLKGEENVMCSVQGWFVAEEGLRTATLGGEGFLPSLLFWKISANQLICARICKGCNSRKKKRGRL